MARDLSANIEAVRSTKQHNVWLAVDITPSTGATIRCAEVELTVTSLNLYGTSVSVDPTLYSAKLQQEPAIKYARKEGTGADLSIIDLDHALGVLVSQVESVLEDAKIVVSTCWQKSDGTFEADIYFVGRIEDVKAESDVTSFSLVTDYEVRNAVVANRILTQTCIAIFGDNKCRKPASMRTEGETCSNIFDDAENGCLAKGWQFAYFGVPTLQLVENYVASSGWQDYSNSFAGASGVYGDYNNIIDLYGCPALDQFVTVYKNKNEIVSVAAVDLRIGQIVVDAHGQAAVIDALDILKAVPCYEILCSNGAGLICSSTHPVITGLDDKIGVFAENLEVGDMCLTFDNARFVSEVSKISAINFVGQRDVMRITLSNKSASLYNSGKTKRFSITGHNNKRSYSVEFDGGFRPAEFDR